MSMNTNTGAKWQPFGDQFQAACRVCFYRDTKCAQCQDCRCEKKPGFAFDPDKYIELYRELTKRRYWISEEFGPVRIDPFQESEELKAVKKDRDFWKSLADKAMQSIVSIAERMADSK
jgi:hypothetical protein